MIDSGDNNFLDITFNEIYKTFSNLNRVLAIYKKFGIIGILSILNETIKTPLIGLKFIQIFCTLFIYKIFSHDTYSLFYSYSIFF